ncbi:MAG TPA: hypothetical protein EYN96_02655 [Candidatus Hydrogenedentes bacterium]|nr:hypothetical protein [Candidatus Hydrogenedentota bacterium]
MADFTDRIKSALGKVRKEAKHKMASSGHKEASQYLEKGRKKYNSKDYKVAGKFFQKAVDADIQYAMAHYYLGLAKYKLNDSEGAIRSWNATIDLGSGSEAAVKADKKLEHHEQRTNRSVNQLQERIKNH